MHAMRARLARGAFHACFHTSFREEREVVREGMGTWQALPSAMYRGSEPVTTRGGGLSAAATGLPPAVACHARAEDASGAWRIPCMLSSALHLKVWRASHGYRAHRVHDGFSYWQGGCSCTVATSTRGEQPSSSIGHARQRLAHTYTSTYYLRPLSR